MIQHQWTRWAVAGICAAVLTGCAHEQPWGAKNGSREPNHARSNAAGMQRPKDTDEWIEATDQINPAFSSKPQKN